MANSKGEYTGTFIPAHIMLDESLSAGGKILYAVIASFNVCFMSNAGLAKRLGVTERSIQRGISDLKERGYVQQVGFNGKTRQICPCRDDINVVSATTQTSPIDKNLDKNIETISSTDSAKSDDLATLFNKLREQLKLSEQYKLSEKRKLSLKRRLKDFTPEQILLAGKHLSESEWHMGENPQRKKFADVDFLLRSYEQVEKWLLVEVEGEQPITQEEIDKIVARQKASVVYA